MEKTKLKIVFFGTAQFAVSSLQTLAEMHEIQAVIAQPDKPSGRKMEKIPGPVKTKALELELPILQPDTLKNNQAFNELLSNLKPDFLVVVAYGKKIPETILNIPRYCAINLHPSILPMYRGASPIQQALLNGDENTGLSFIKMEDKMDAGDIFYLRKVAIGKEENYPLLSAKLAEIGAVIFPSLLSDISMEILTPLAQDEKKTTHCQKISKGDGKIDWHKEESNAINNKLRAFTPWPGCFTTLDNKRVKILSAKPGEEKNLKPGHTSINTEEKLVVGCKNSSLIVEELQMEGKKALTSEQFIKGYNKEIEFN